MSAITARLTLEFQSWMRDQGPVATTALLLATESLMRPLTMDEAGELMALCFAAGRLVDVSDQHSAELMAAQLHGAH